MSDCLSLFFSSLEGKYCMNLSGGGWTTSYENEELEGRVLSNLFYDSKLIAV